MAKKEKMTSRERVLTAINHKEPDRVPIDIGSTPSSGISAIAYHNLKRYLMFSKGNTRVYDVVQQLAQPEDYIIETLKIDVLDVGRVFNTYDEDWYDTKTYNTNKVYNDIPIQYPIWFHPIRNANGDSEVFHSDGTKIAIMTKGALFYDQVYFPYLEGYPSDYSGLPEAMRKVQWAAMPQSPFDHGSEPDFWEQLRENTIDLRENTDKALVIGAGCNLFEWGSFLRRMDKFLMDLIRDQDNVVRLLDALMELHLSLLENLCEAVGDVVDIIKFGDDLGENSGPFMNPKIYRKIFKPRHEKLCKYVKDNSSAHTMLHCCGSIYDLIPDLIEVGFEILNPVQINAINMDPKDLKENFGKNITFWGGGADTRNVINRKSPEEVKKHVIELLEIFSPGGGYVWNTVHNILPDVPPENIIAMFEGIHEYNDKIYLK